jgi:hypothetical protein
VQPYRNSTCYSPQVMNGTGTRRPKGLGKLQRGL